MSTIDIYDEIDFLADEDIDFLRNFSKKSHKIFLDRINMTEEEYTRQCAPYLEEVSSFVEIINAQKGKKQELENLLTANSVREEKSKGGESIHRGYYCPSLILDIVVGNCKRGNLCKRNNSKATYIHYFDCTGRHIATKQQDENIVSTEYILYSENKSIGILFNGLNEVEAISECEYDENGRIIKYTHVLCGHRENIVIECYKELYSYFEDSLIVETSNLFCISSPVILNLNKYVFKVEDGFLKNYTVEVFDSEDLSNQPLENRFYNINIKRKIPTQTNC